MHPLRHVGRAYEVITGSAYMTKVLGFRVVHPQGCTMLQEGVGAYQSYLVAELEASQVCLA